MIAISPHPFGSTSEAFTLIGSRVWTLGHFIALLINVFQGSIIVANGVMYLVRPSSWVFMAWYIVFL
jgi:hypothetical protein